MEDPVAWEKDALNSLSEKDAVVPWHDDIGHAEYDLDRPAPVPTPLGRVAGGRGCTHWAVWTGNFDMKILSIP